MARVTFNGDAGTRFRNDTPKVLYQFHASLINTCGVCLQYHMAVGPWWPIPMHRGCKCRQSLVAPGAEAEPFVDYREMLRDMPPDQQTAAIGRSCYTLIEKGVVPWDEVVTKGRVRTLREVVSRRKLTVDQMTKAGVNPHIAQNAFASVNTPAHQIKYEQRKQLVKNLTNVGLSPEQIKQGFGSKMSERIGIAEGPSKAQRFKPQWSDGASLAKFLGLDAAKVAKALGTKIAKDSLVSKNRIPPKLVHEFEDWLASLDPAERERVLALGANPRNFRDFLDKP